MRTVGIDLAVQPQKTGIAHIDWDADGLGTATVRTGADDRAILAELLASTTDVIGLDVPLGWPTRFVEMLVAHRDHQPIKAGDWPKLYDAMRMRTTDHWIRENFGANPISVSANMIGATAMRAAWLLSQAEQAGLVVDRSGLVGKVVEVYPAGALRQWGISTSGYKARRAVATDLQRVFTAVTNGLRLTVASDVVNDHELDALVCAVVARMARTGRTHEISEEHLETARREGWIHVPVSPLR
jgi:predicted nuclease with RNAse H fold